MSNRGKRESLKEYLNRFCALSVKLQTQDEEMVVAAFAQGMTTSSFISLIRNPVEMLSKVRERATAHTEAKKAVLRKNGSSRSKQPRPKENSRYRSAKCNEASTEKRTNPRYVSYVVKNNEPKTKSREETTIRLKF